MTPAQILLVISGVMLAVATGLALYRLAKGPSSLDRGVASDVVLAIVAVGVAQYAAWTHQPMVLVISLVLSLLGFTSAVGLARLITGATEQERRFREAEAAAAYAESPVKPSAQASADDSEVAS
ncbi:monovalent cation/H+ antiporter complex subunit F [Aestuariimicrobium ganziense]|uniref:monovalent cation/H+ antiporter complex subunit F n=1 Tax=Aestuariimicrobium ganziense TaxID=2773677 RepID=UPI0019408595|nr:monovalent cation/H+ antiporter complex subunit F [Aestuariimicrobium ganziense]